MALKTKYIDSQLVVYREQQTEGARSFDGQRIISQFNLVVSQLVGGGGWCAGLNVDVVRPVTQTIGLREMANQQFIPNLSGIVYPS